MARIKEIEQAANKKYMQSVSGYNIFIKGAEWADETMLDRVCEWVKKHYIEYAHNRLGQEYIIDDLREAMKGE